MAPKKRKTQAWESPITDWLKRHDVPKETIDLFIPYLFRKKVEWELPLMREMILRKKEYTIADL